MKKFIFSLFVIFSINSFAETNPGLDRAEDRSWRLSYLSFESFLALPNSAQIEYVGLARTFLLQQEIRKANESSALYEPPRIFQKVFGVAEAFAAESSLTFADANGRCHYLEEKSNLSKALQDLVRKGRDQCVIAGQPVCMNIVEIKNEKRLVCRLDQMPALAKELKCDEKKPQLIACGGLFLDRAGQQICVEPKAGSTSVCEKNAMKTADLIEYFRNSPNAKRTFEVEFLRIKRYCGRSKDNANFIDIKDCEILNQRLADLEKQLPDSEKIQDLADCVFKAREEAPQLKSDLRFRFQEKGSKNIHVEVSGQELRNWSTYDGTGKIKKIDQNFLSNKQNNSLQIARWFDQPTVFERFEPNYFEGFKSDCKASVTLKRDYFGKMKNGNCEISVKKRDGQSEVVKIAVKSANGDKRFNEENRVWVPEEHIKLPDLFGAPKEKSIAYMTSRKTGTDQCVFGVRWDIDGEPVVAKAKSKNSGDPNKSQQQRR